MARIPLLARDGTVRAVTTVDDDDYELLSQWTWRLHDGYAVRRVGERGTVRMHRYLLGLQAGDRRQADHRNRDRLDNRRENLRVVTQGQNMQNRGARRTARSGTRGVSFHTRSGRWTVRVQVEGRSHFIGLYDTVADAEQAATAARRRLSPFATD